MKNQKPLKNGLVLIYFKEKTKADLAGFEPAICSLGDCRPIQARLQAQDVNVIRNQNNMLCL